MHRDQVARPDELVQFDVMHVPTGTFLGAVQHEEDMVAKSPNVTKRIENIKAAIAKMERELEEAKGPRKEALRMLIAKEYETLRRLAGHTLH